MKRFVFSLAALLALATSCSHSSSMATGVLKETYLHKYGVAVSRAEWEQAGQTGKIITVLKDGRTETRSYRGGILDGETSITFPHSTTIEQTITYNEGNPVREVWNYPSGMPNYEKRAEASGTFVLTSWYESGIPKSVEEHSGEHLISGSYTTQNNESESQVVNGDGIRIERDGWGQLVSNDKFEGGKLVAVTTFHPNGTPKEIIPYANGQVSGTKRVFLPNGEPLRVEEWKNDMQNGTTITFKNGVKASEVTYIDGLRNGLEKRYNENEVLVEEVNWLNGNKHGATTIVLGDKSRTEFFHRGKLVSETVFHELNSHVR